jgi:Holliday junction resolvase RusA-like endonuclease
MSNALTFTIPGPPVPNARARRGRGGNHYTPDKTRAYRNRVAWECTRKRLATWPLHARYAVELTFHMPNSRRADADNLAKGVLDALNGIAWEDDSQVQRLVVEKRIDRANPRAEVTIEILEQDR